MHSARRTVAVATLPTLVVGLLALPVVTFQRAAEPVEDSSQALSLAAFATGGQDDPGLPDAVAADGRAAPEPDEDVETVVDTPRLPADDFRVAGITWEAGSVTGEVHAYVRTRQDDGWTPWYVLEDESDDGPDPGTAEAQGARAGTAPLIVEDSDAVEVKVATEGGQVPEDPQVELIDPGTSAADGSVDSAPLASAAAAVGKPTIYTRAQWGANEKLREQSKPDYGTIKAAVVHHTAGSNSYSRADVPSIIRGVYAYHVKGRGWRDIGYNVLVDKFGRAWEGRWGGLGKSVTGAHALNNNSTTLGVSVMGNFDSAAPTSAVVRKVAKVIAWKFDRAGVRPSGSWTYTTNTGARVTKPKVVGHRDVGQTACPGAKLYAKIPAIRSRVTSFMTDRSGRPSRVSASAAPLDYTVGGNRIDVAVSVATTDDSGVVPKGTVEIADIDSGRLVHGGPVALVKGSATVKLLLRMPAGTHRLRVSYNGSSGVAWSSSPVFEVTAHKATTRTVATFSRATMVSGQATTTDVRVTASGARPDGTVTVLSGSTPVGSAKVRRASASGTSRATVALRRDLSARTHRLTVRYEGSSSFRSSAGGAATLVVTKGTTRLSASVSKDRRYGQRPVVHVRAKAYGQTPSGRIVVREGSRVVGRKELTGGDANLRVTRTTSMRTRRFTVSYAGSGQLRGAPTEAASLTVLKAKPKVKRSLNKHSVRRGQRAKLRFRAKATGVQVRGVLVVKDHGRRIKKVHLRRRDGGSRTIRLPRLLRGRHAITVGLRERSQVLGYHSKPMRLRVR